MMLTTSGTYDDEEGAVLVLAGCDDVMLMETLSQPSGAGDEGRGTRRTEMPNAKYQQHNPNEQPRSIQQGVRR